MQEVLACCGGSSEHLCKGNFTPRKGRGKNRLAGGKNKKKRRKEEEGEEEEEDEEGEDEEEEEEEEEKVEQETQKDNVDVVKS